MSLARTYATVFRELSKSNAPEVVEQMITYMKQKGHLSVLPEMLRIVEREQQERAEVHISVARESDTEKHKKDIEEALQAVGSNGSSRTSIDPNIVGGFSVRSGSRMVDATIRTSLVNIYQNAIS
ncbi:hypothetical protein COU15_00480 [Candidatus Kaiserbacteria bacterium CG10_big_fil_rev_8_21_14_0_10_45_20]|uniref:Uncharacterized protein n=1 Tax=Candidatus Kaiserbacteria bacterium CG10_big_fil_rev_8_21_14_0_10_45_20 TaxID=1974607 RepID=A0A2H0UGM8_9BACT|nr:MAG: hypothetical protein COU15_00480 [Candidatus Kaiserbacteria bacterium CG10_big_fil_rev_8_21_14_0_10_45_20]